VLWKSILVVQNFSTKVAPDASRALVDLPVVELQSMVVLKTFSANFTNPGAFLEGMGLANVLAKSFLALTDFVA